MILEKWLTYELSGGGDGHWGRQPRALHDHGLCSYWCDDSVVIEATAVRPLSKRLHQLILDSCLPICEVEPVPIEGRTQVCLGRWADVSAPHGHLDDGVSNRTQHLRFQRFGISSS